MENKLMNIEAVANAYDNDLIKVANKIRSLQSKKCTWNKNKKGHPQYAEVMAETLADIELMQQVKRLLEGHPKKTSLSMTAEEISQMEYTEAVAARESVRSKMSRTRWKTDVEGDNDEFRHAAAMEKLYTEHIKSIKPITDGTIRKTKVQEIIDLIDATPDISIERITELLRNIIK